MAKIGTLAAKVTLDTSDLTSGIVLTKREFKTAGQVIEAQAGPLAGYRAQLAGLDKLHAGGALSVAQHSRAVGMLRQEFVSGLPIVGRFSGLMNPLTLGLTAGAVGFTAITGAIAGATTALVGFTADRISKIDDIGDAAARVGMSISGLSRLQSAAILGDVDPALVTSSITKMLANVGKGSDAFAQLNLDVNQLKQLAPEEIFRRVAVEIGKLDTTADKMAALKEVFGKAGGDLLPLINDFEKLDAAALRSGAVISDELGEKVNALDTEWKTLKMTVEGFGNTLVSLSVEPLTEMLAKINLVATNTTVAHAAVKGFFTSWIGQATELALINGNLSTSMHALIDMHDTAKQEQRNALPIRSDSMKAQEAIDIATEAEKKEEAKAEKAEKRLEKERSQMLQDAKDKLTAFNRGEDDVAKDKMARLGGSEEEQRAVALEIQKLEVLKEQEKAREQYEQNEKRRNSERASALKQVKKEAASLAESILPDKEKMEAEFARKRGVLEAAGMATPERLAMLAKQEVQRLGSKLGPAGFGAPGAAVKGSAAAREIIEQSKHEDAQEKLLGLAVKQLEKIAGKKPLELVVVDGGA